MKRWLKGHTENSKEALLLSLNGMIRATITDKSISCLGQTFKNYQPTEELAMEFAERKCNEIALECLNAHFKRKF